MKSDRMFGILCILLERENVTARELAEYFEVSTRTIHRDLLDLSASGFPVVTRQGVGGGVSLLPNFRYNKSALSEDDMKVILAGIEGLATIDDSARMKTLLAKLRFSDGNRLLLENDIWISLPGIRTALSYPGSGCCGKRSPGILSWKWVTAAPAVR